MRDVDKLPGLALCHNMEANPQKGPGLSFSLLDHVLQGI